MLFENKFTTEKEERYDKAFGLRRDYIFYLQASTGNLY